MTESQVQQRVLRIFRNVAGLMAIEEDGRSARVGSAVLVNHGAERFLLTSDHVIAGITDHGGKIRMELASSESSAPQVEFEYVPEVVWRSKTLDAALLSCPESLKNSPSAGWFDLLANASLTTKVRTERLKHDTETTSLPYFVVGIPNFARMKFEAARMEVHGVVSLPGYVTQLEAHPWVGDRDKAPQMHLELDMDSPNPMLKPGDTLGAAMYARAATTLFETGVEFGGISGGPVILIDHSGEFLLGIVKEGAVLFGNKVVVATALDDIASMPGFPRASVRP